MTWWMVVGKVEYERDSSYSSLVLDANEGRGELGTGQVALGGSLLFSISLTGRAARVPLCEEPAPTHLATRVRRFQDQLRLRGVTREG